MLVNYGLRRLKLAAIVWTKSWLSSVVRLARDRGMAYDNGGWLWPDRDQRIQRRRWCVLGGGRCWPMRKADLPVSDCLIWRTSEIRPAGVRGLTTDEFAIALLLPCSYSAATTLVVTRGAYSLALWRFCAIVSQMSRAWTQTRQLCRQRHGLAHQLPPPITQHSTFHSLCFLYHHWYKYSQSRTHFTKTHFWLLRLQK